MNSHDILWKIIHERDVTKFDRIIPLLHEIGLENKPEVRDLNDYSISPQSPYLIYATTRKTAAILKRAGYNNPYANEYPWARLDKETLRNKIIEKVRERKYEFFGDLPDELRILGCGQRHEIKIIEDNITTRHYKPLLEETIRLTLKLLGEN